MSFLYKSIFGGDNRDLHGDSAYFPTFTNGISNLTGFTSLVINRLGWQDNGLFQLKRSSNDVIGKLNELWSSVQSSSSVMHISNAWKILQIEEFYQGQFCPDTLAWVHSAVPYLHKVLEQINQDVIENQNILEDFSGLEDLSDVIRDFIKTIKVLVTYDKVVHVQEDFIGSHQNTQHAGQEKQRNKRYIG